MMASTKVLLGGVPAQQIIDSHGQAVVIANSSGGKVQLTKNGSTIVFTNQNVQDLITVLQGYVSNGSIT